MEGKPANGAVNGGVCLSLAGQKKISLSPGGNHLEISEPSMKNRLRSTCKSITAGSCGLRIIPLFNVLWLEISGAELVIDYAAQTSKTSIKLEKWSFDLAAEGKLQSDQFVSQVLARAYSGSQLQKKAYVLINPHAGPGGALRKWNEVKPLFQAARMQMDVTILREGGEAAKLAEEVDIDKYDTVMACSGDGTPHEIFNGLAKRSDAARALSKMAISHIPCGSGNALSCNLYGTNRPSYAALAIIKGHVTPIDLVSITQGGRRTLSFLSQSLGIVAESDLGTENLRWMGGSRFEVGFLMRIFRRRCYPCDLAVKVEVATKEEIKARYQNCTNKSRALTSSVTYSSDHNDGHGLPPLKYGTIMDRLPDGWELKQYDKIGNFYCGNMAFMAPNTKVFEAALPFDGSLDLVTVNGDLSPMTATKLLYSVESGKFFDNEHVQYQKVSAYRIIPRDQKGGYISIDGERVPFEPFQAEVHQGLGRVISKRAIFEPDSPTS